MKGPIVHPGSHPDSLPQASRFEGGATSSCDSSRARGPRAVLVAALIVVFALLLSCQAMSFRQNYAGFKADEEIGFFVQKGYRFRLDGDLNEPVDRLNLVPGAYLIEFVDTFTGMKGATYCEVKKGTRYEVYPGGYRDFPKAMKRVLIGTCYPQAAEKK